MTKAEIMQKLENYRRHEAAHVRDGAWVCQGYCGFDRSEELAPFAALAALRQIGEVAPDIDPWAQHEVLGII